MNEPMTYGQRIRDPEKGEGIVALDRGNKVEIEYPAGTRLIWYKDRCRIIPGE